MNFLHFQSICPTVLAGNGVAKDTGETQPMDVMALPDPPETQTFSSAELSGEVRRMMYQGDRNTAGKDAKDTPQQEPPLDSGDTSEATVGKTQRSMSLRMMKRR